MAEISVLLAGVARSGKSTLLWNLCGSLELEDVELQSDYSVNIRYLERNGYTIKIIEPPCPRFLFQAPPSCMELRGHLDLLLLCISISPLSKFSGNPEMMTSLQLTYGKEIWKHCILIFTFSNVALEYDQGGAERYMRHVQKIFQCELERLGIWDVRTAMVFDSTAPRILAIPAGFFPEDKVLQALDYHQNQGWVDAIFLEIVAKYEYDSSGFFFAKRGSIRDRKFLTLGVLLVILGFVISPVATIAAILLLVAGLLLILLRYSQPTQQSLPGASSLHASPPRQKQGNTRHLFICRKARSCKIWSHPSPSPPCFEQSRH